MATVLLTVVLMFVIVAAMAIGVMFGRQPIKGSCGGMSALGMKGDCEICGGDLAKCDEASRTPEKKSSSADAVRRFDPRQP